MSETDLSALDIRTDIEPVKGVESWYVKIEDDDTQAGDADE